MGDTDSVRAILSPARSGKVSKGKCIVPGSSLHPGMPPMFYPVWWASCNDCAWVKKYSFRKQRKAERKLLDHFIYCRGGNS